LVASIEETKKQMEGDLEKLIKKRKQVAENMDQFTQLSNAYEASFLERIEFVEEKEEEEEETGK
jgi:hypothetical protein